MSNYSSPKLPPFPSSYRASGLLFACYVVALALRHWRRGTNCHCVDQPTVRRRTKLVASVALGPDGLWQLALSIALVVRRQRAFN